MEAPGTHPEDDVESEDKILDAAAHFVSFKMLSRHHLGRILVWREGIRSREPLRGESGERIRARLDEAPPSAAVWLPVSEHPAVFPLTSEMGPPMDPRSRVCPLRRHDSCQPRTSERWTVRTDRRDGGD